MSKRADFALDVRPDPGQAHDLLVGDCKDKTFHIFQTTLIALVSVILWC